jgi:Na+/glutamate symporter
LIEKQMSKPSRRCGGAGHRRAAQESVAVDEKDQDKDKDKDNVSLREQRAADQYCNDALVISSWFFLLTAFYVVLIDHIDPAAVADENGSSMGIMGVTSSSQSILPSYAVLSVITALISANYWRRVPTLGIRRQLDLVVAKVSFAIYFLTGVMYVRDTFLLSIGIPICVSIGICYQMSHVRYSQQSAYWVYYHMSFHLFVAIEQLIVVVSLARALR